MYQSYIYFNKKYKIYVNYSILQDIKYFLFFIVIIRLYYIISLYSIKKLYNIKYIKKLSFFISYKIIK